MRFAAMFTLFFTLLGADSAAAAAQDGILGMPHGIFTALVAAAVALIGVAANGWFTWRNYGRQEQLVASNALTAYRFDARKRLYTECEPVLFQLNEACEQAFQTCALLGTKRYCDRLAIAPDAERKDPDSWMMCRATETIATAYNLLHPLALYFILRDRMTRVDCTLDPEVSLQYRLARLLVRSFQDDTCIAMLAPALPYSPRVEGWREKRRSNPARYWWQGATPGRLDRAVRMMLTPTGETKRVLTYGEFEDLYLKLYHEGERDSQKTLGVFANPLYGFTPDSRPVFWRLILIQAHLHRTLSRPLKTFANTPRTEEAVRRFMSLPNPALFNLAEDKGWRARSGRADRNPDAALAYLVGQLAT